MADYNDYLEYLHHVDDTTAQEFKKKEDELRHQIDVLRDQCQKDIKNIQERAAAEKAQLVVDHKSAIDSLTSKYESSIEKLKTEKKQVEAANKAELKKLNEEKENAITQMSNEYESSIEKLKIEKKQVETAHKAELKRINAEKENAIAKLTNEHKSAMEVALFDMESKQKSEVQRLMNKMSQYEHLLQQKEDASSDLIKKHHQEVTELNLKHEKQIEIINEHNEEKLRGLASQLQSEKDKLNDIEKIWQNKLLLNNQEHEQKLKEQETEKNKYLSVISDERKRHEQHVARLNHDIQALKSENNSIRASRLTTSNQLEDAKRKNGILEGNLNEMMEKIKELEKGIPAMDSKSGLLAILLFLFILGLIIIYIFI